MFSEPMVVCTYGWGRLLRLYRDRVDIDGMVYALTRITHVQPHYRHILGISSVRLEVYFAEDVHILRGMPLLPETQICVEYLTRWAIANAQRSQKQTAMNRGLAVKETPVPEPHPARSFDEQKPTSFSMQPPLSRVPQIEIPRWMLLRREQRERRLKRLQLERSFREYGFDVAGLSRRLQEEALPHVQVPLRLLPDEHAHYSSEATLCEEPLAGTSHQRYIVRDQGSLIFTNRRMIYLGRKSQYVIPYPRLFHVSTLPGALTFQAEHWARREVFELPRPLEAKMYLEAILKMDREARGQTPGTPAASRKQADALRFTTSRRAIEDEITQPLPVLKGMSSSGGTALSPFASRLAEHNRRPGQDAGRAR